MRAQKKTENSLDVGYTGLELMSLDGGTTGVVQMYSITMFNASEFLTVPPKPGVS